uniref:Uncharacterized protein n=1 Tax=Anguilla anguilla TaxID=7936 RepID=A0A0E9W2Z7_ANGAN
MYPDHTLTAVSKKVYSESLHARFQVQVTQISQY